MKHRSKNVITAGILLCFAILFLSGCKNRQPDITDRLYLGVTYYNQSDRFLNELITCLKEELHLAENELLETTIAIRDAAGSQRTQNDQVKELIDAGCNVLCVNLVERADPSDIIDIAREHHIPIIFFNREPVAIDMQQWEKLYYVGADSRQSGVLQGELAAEMIAGNPQIDRNKDGKIQYVVLEGEPGHQDTIIRTETAVDTLKQQGIELEKLSYGIANWNRAQAENRMSQIISKHQNKTELVLSNNDEMVLGAMDAYARLNFTESAYPVFFGIDGTALGLQAVKDGRMLGTIYNDKEAQAKAMTDLAVALVSGKGMKQIEFTKERYIYTKYQKVTQDNVSDFLR